MSEEENHPISGLQPTLLQREQLLKKLLKTTAARTSAITKDLLAFEAYSTLLLQSGVGPSGSSTGGAPRVVVRRGQPMNAGIVSNQSVQARAQSGGTATLGKRSSSSTTSAKATSGSATSSGGPTVATSTPKSKAQRSG